MQSFDEQSCVYIFIIWISFFTLLSPAVVVSVPGACLQLCSVNHNQIFSLLMPLLKKLWFFLFAILVNNSYCIPLSVLTGLLWVHAFYTSPFKYDSHPLPSSTACLPDCFSYLQHSASPIEFLRQTPVTFLLFLCKANMHCALLKPFSLDLGDQQLSLILFVQYNPTLYQSNKTTIFLGLAFALWFWQVFFSLKRQIWIVLHSLFITDGYFFC